MTPAAERSSRPPLAPWFLALAILLLLVALLVTLLRSRPPTRNAPPAAADLDVAVAAWTGESALARGGRLTAQLTPLHADRDHQAFEANALRRRLGLQEGEPWRLRLRWEAAAAAGGSSGAVGTDLERGPLAALALEGFELVDEQGVAARTLARPAAGDRPVDPVATLLAPPGGSLAPGEAVDAVLWGRAAAGGARLLGGEAQIELMPTSVPRSELERPITRRVRGEERVELGKNAAAGASEARASGSVTSDG